MSLESLCDIIILTIDGLEYLKPCLESIEKNTPQTVNVYIVDNGSGPETRKYLDSLKGNPQLQYHVYHHDKNIGYVTGNNEAVKLGNSKYICLLNNDTIVTEGWLEKLIQTFSIDDKTGAVNPTCNVKKNEVAIANIPKYAQEMEGNNLGIIREIGMVSGYCLLTSRKVIEKEGLFNEAIDTAYFEDADFSLRLRSRGYKLIIRKDTFVYHHEHGTLKRSPEFETLFQKNKKWFLSEWGNFSFYHALYHENGNAVYPKAIREICLSECFVREVAIGENLYDEKIPGLLRKHFSEIVGQVYFFFKSLFKIKKPYQALIANSEKFIPLFKFIKSFRNYKIVFVSESAPSDLIFENIDVLILEDESKLGHLDKNNPKVFFLGNLLNLRKHV